MCDAQHIGSIDGPAPERASQDIPPSVARFVWRRDGGRCRVDGCRSARGLELHHIIHRADGGSHDALNLILCCSRCHQSHHAGLLTISGTAEQLVIHRSGQATACSAGPSLTHTNAIRNTGAHVGASASTRASLVAVACTGSADATSSPVGADAHVGAWTSTTASLVAAVAPTGLADATSSLAGVDAHVGAAHAMVPLRAAVLEVDVFDASTTNTPTYANADAEAAISEARTHMGTTDPPTPRDVCTRVDTSEAQRGRTEVSAEGSAARVASAAGRGQARRRDPLHASQGCTHRAWLETCRRTSRGRGGSSTRQRDDPRALDLRVIAAVPGAKGVARRVYPPIAVEGIDSSA
ncbi:MAG: hypothetical protein E6J91_47590 [Deltaproteobacteria bacterium]|nr:MAG: hypothetical protein E6J91_47590 [Deltaproteobacteria bacterium]